MVRTTSEAVSKEDRTRDKYYNKTYGISLELYNLIGEAQGWRCAACGRPASDFTVRLNVDHEHFTIHAVRIEGEEPPWMATTTVRGHLLRALGKTKKAATEELRTIALPLSVRGLLCPGRYTGCNRLLGRVDRPAWLRAVLDYLENPPAHGVIPADFS